MPSFVPRSQWNDRGNPPGGYDMNWAVPNVVIHHTPDEDPMTYAEALFHVRSIRNSHIDVNGWQDIGYSFLVWDDYVFEGRGWGHTGAHAPGANSSSIGIAMLMDGRYRTPSDRELNSAAWLVEQSISNGYLSSQFTTTPHRFWVPTGCPGFSDDQIAVINDALHGGSIESFGVASVPTTSGEGDDMFTDDDRRLLTEAWRAVRTDNMPTPNANAYEVLHHLMLSVAQGMSAQTAAMLAGDNEAVKAAVVQVVKDALRSAPGGVPANVDVDQLAAAVADKLSTRLAS